MVTHWVLKGLGLISCVNKLDVTVRTAHVGRCFKCSPIFHRVKQLISDAVMIFILKYCYILLSQGLRQKFWSHYGIDSHFSNKENVKLNV